MLLFNASDDPLCPEPIVEAMTLFNQNEKLIFVKTYKGAHCLFFDHIRNYMRTTWFEEAVLEYLDALEKEP